MIEILSLYDDVYISDQRLIDGKLGLLDDKYIYFIMSIDDEEVIHMEQATLAQFLFEQGLQQVVHPMVNRNGHWITEFGGKRYMVYKYAGTAEQVSVSHGQKLAQFHQQNYAYPFEPNYISSYGKWKSLWIDKLTSFEQEINELEHLHVTYHRLALDMLPYIIGISENAIQYLDESIRFATYHESDQGTITFQRYDQQILKPIIWPEELMYDHPMRDVAELIRKILWLSEQGVLECYQFLQDYHQVNPLSQLSWRLLYARLIFPIHFFDVFAEIFKQVDIEDSGQQLSILIHKQPMYEQRLRELFKQFEFKDEDPALPMIEWI